MRIAWTRRLSLMAICGIALVSFGGCLDLGGDDSPSDDPALVAAQDELADGLADMAIGATIGALEGLITWSEGIQPTREASVIWNATDQAWHISETETYEDPEAYGSLTITWWVQFRTDGVPQQEPSDLMDQIEIRLTAHNEGNFHPGDFSVDFDLDAAYEMTATRNSDNSTAIVGAGTLDGESSMTLNDNVYPREHHITWNHDFTAAPDQACVSGNLAGTTGDYTFNATFDGAGGVAWTLSRSGDQIATGTREYDCDPPVL